MKKNIKKIKLNNFDFYITNEYEWQFTKIKFENNSSKILLDLLKKNDTFLDIGAHYGYYTMLVGKNIKNVKLIAIEANKNNIDILKKNLVLNKLSNKSSVFNVAASDKIEEIKFHLAKTSSRSSMYEIRHSELFKTIKIISKRIDDIVSEKISVIKIDVEGNEIKTLNGLKNILKKNRSIKILIEFNPKSQISAAYNPKELLEKLVRELNFDIYGILDYPWQKPDNDEILYKDVYEMYKLTNKVEDWKMYVNQNHHLNLFCIPKKDKSKLITFFSHSNQLGGSELSMIELIRELKEKNIFSHVVLPGFGPLEDELKSNNVPYDVINLNWWANIGKPDFNEVISSNSSSFKNLADFLPKLSLINPDLIYSNTIVSPWGAIAANYLNKPHIWHIREYGELDHKLNFVVPYNETISFIETYSDKIITNSKSVLNYVSKYLKNKKPDFAYNYVEIDKNLLKEKIKSPFKIKKSLKILICGTLSEGKNQIEAIRAIKELIENKVSIELLLVGGASDENYLKKIKEYISECGIDKNIHVLGFINNPYPYFKISDVVLVSSQKEAYGRTAVEAMLLKKPVVTTLGGGTKEIVKNGLGGFTYNVGDVSSLKKILFKLQDKKLQKKIGMYGFNSLKEINSKENYGYKIANIIQNVVDNYKPNNELTKIITNVFIGSYKQSKDNQSDLEKQLSILKNKENELKEQLLKIFGSKTYMYWQKFNKIKSLIFKKYFKY